MYEVFQKLSSIMTRRNFVHAADSWKQDAGTFSINVWVGVTVNHSWQMLLKGKCMGHLTILHPWNYFILTSIKSQLFCYSSLLATSTYMAVKPMSIDPDLKCMVLKHIHPTSKTFLPTILAVP
ncbi:hypothetical protein EDC04DRAFT_2608607 [Pisolithus marmoratus]|nr:hypothetical protein EDC04DRAFT_2608607 [Pisolithus marmoratus]